MYCRQCGKEGRRDPGFAARVGPRYGKLYTINYNRPKLGINKSLWMTRRVRQAQILSTGELRTVIEREGAIVDRHGNAFSLLVFGVGTTTLEDVSIQHLVRTLRCRVRSTDEVGWLDRQRIGVVLPHTSSPAARKLADAVSKLIASPEPPPTYTVYSYPSHWPFAISSPECQEEMLQDLPRYSSRIRSR